MGFFDAMNKSIDAAVPLAMKLHELNRAEARAEEQWARGAEERELRKRELAARIENVNEEQRIRKDLEAKSAKTSAGLTSLVNPVPNMDDLDRGVNPQEHFPINIQDVARVYASAGDKTGLERVLPLISRENTLEQQLFAKDQALKENMDAREKDRLEATERVKFIQGEISKRLAEDLEAKAARAAKVAETGGDKPRNEDPAIRQIESETLDLISGAKTERIRPDVLTVLNQRRKALGLPEIIEQKQEGGGDRKWDPGTWWSGSDTYQYVPSGTAKAATKGKGLQGAMSADGKSVTHEGKSYPVTNGIVTIDGKKYKVE